MRPLALALAVLALLACVPLLSGRAASPPPAQREVAAGYVLVKLDPDAQVALPDGSEPVLGTWYKVPIAPGDDPFQAAERWAAVLGVVEAQPDAIIQLAPPMPMEPETIAEASAGRKSYAAGPFGQAPESIPNDPLYNRQWNLPMIQAEQAWELATGAGVRVAVVDSGVSRGTDLACVVFVDEYNAITGQSGPGTAADDYSHGTHVAGTIAQCTNNGIGVAGLAPDVLLMPVKVLNSGGSGTFADVAEGVEWARTHNAAVINLSLGKACGLQAWPGCAEPILDDAIEAATASGALVVAAAGNVKQATVMYPANHPDVVAVTAVDPYLNRALYAHQGAALDLAAPGGNLAVDLEGITNGGGILQQTIRQGVWQFEYKHGTSMAAAHVSGAAALLLSHVPGATAAQVRAALEDTAQDLGASGFDTTFGHGLIQIADALAEVRAAGATSTPTPTVTPTATASPTNTVTPTVTPTPEVVNLWLPLLARE